MKLAMFAAVLGTALAVSCTTVPAIQVEAERVTEIINSQSPALEYGTFIYCNEDNCWSPDVIAGGPTSIDLSDALVEEDFGFLRGSIAQELNIDDYIIFIIGPDDKLRGYSIP